MGIRLGLDAIRSLLGRLGNPQESFPSVLIAGTNGKGSVAGDDGLDSPAAGFRTGLYTSPDLIDLRERIRIDGRMIGRAEMAACAEEIRGRLREEVSYFEFLTAIAFLYFQRQKMDIAVLEVGLGGRLDATNVVTPLVSVITNISLEHRAYLGNTLAEIAREKGGSSRRGESASPRHGRRRSSGRWRRSAGKEGPDSFGWERRFERRSIGTGRFHTAGIGRRHEGLRSPLAGRHQIANAALALAAVEQLNACRFPGGGRGRFPRG